jgi:hypothetical protein
MLQTKSITKFLLAVVIATSVCFGMTLNYAQAYVGLLNTHFDKDPSLVAYYQLSDTSDSKGTNTLTNVATTTFASALFGNGAEFGSANTTKKLTAGTLGLTATSTMWIHGWFRIETAPTSGNLAVLASYFNNNGKYFVGIYWNVSGTLRLRVGDLGSYTDYITTLTIGKWYMMDFVRDEGVAQLYTLYLNGSSVATAGLGVDTNGGSGFTIGDDPPNDGYLSGMADDVAVFSRVPSAKEISLLYNYQRRIFNGITK